MKKIASAFIAFCLITLYVMIPIAAYAQTPAAKCDGPAQLCAQLAELQKNLDQTKTEKESVKADASKDKDRAIWQNNKDTTNQASKLIGIAATLAVVLKMLLTGLRSWSTYFNTDKGKAWLRIFTLIVGMIAFITTNIGMGLPIWQALIVAGGGPASIVIHECIKLVNVLRGKETYIQAEKTDANDKPQEESEADKELKQKDG